jgi:L,D-peptidoglycan transpeptidase YkuD (ErfK/YbiS/YcfS/YnhG family)
MNDAQRIRRRAGGQAGLKLGLLCAAACLAGCASGTVSARLPAGSSQALVVVAGPRARLVPLERAHPTGRWQPVGPGVPVVLGRAGLAPAGPGLPAKREGDGATPVGTFPLVRAFGRASAFPTRLPYLPLTPVIEAVDDPASRFYNRIVDRRAVKNPDWKSAEKMLRDDGLYDLGVVVGFNPAPAVPGRGSCIFLHIWKSPASTTSGCIAMARPDLERLVRWLDPAARPVVAVSPPPAARFP